MADYYIAVDENGQAYLAHHGILGQKWGIRRYQNDDGSLTEAGKARYAKSVEKATLKRFKEIRDNGFHNNSKVLKK